MYVQNIRKLLQEISEGKNLANWAISTFKNILSQYCKLSVKCWRQSVKIQSQEPLQKQFGNTGSRVPDECV
jgi:hypothetical protein